MPDPISARRSPLAYEVEPSETYEQCINRERAEGSESGGELGAAGGCISGAYGGMTVGTAGGPVGMTVGAIGGCAAGAIGGYFVGATSGAAIAETRAKVSCDTPSHPGSPSANAHPSPALRSPTSATPSPVMMPGPWAPTSDPGDAGVQSSSGASCADGRSVEDALMCGPHATFTTSDVRRVIIG